MAKYKLTNQAVSDLADIWDYTIETWSENQAEKYYQQIIDACQNLAKNPENGKQYFEVYKQLLGFKVRKHIIFYQVISDSQIKITRILHERMDLENRIDE